jgi:hypothetical protein
MCTWKPILVPALVFALTATACERADQEGEDLAPADTAIVEETGTAGVEASYQLVITNPMPHAMNVTAMMPDGGQVQLGSVPANAESTFTVVGSGGEVVTVVATDEGNTHSPSGEITLPSDATTVRWTIE